MRQRVFDVASGTRLTRYAAGCGNSADSEKGQNSVAFLESQSACALRNEMH